MASERQQGAGVDDAGGDLPAFPTSFAQERLWLLEQLEGNLVAYNIPYALRLRGPLDAESLRRSLETIVARHEPLHTNFRAEDGEPVQVVSPPRPLDLPCHDLRAMPPEDMESTLAALRHAESERPFDLRTDLMLRAQLVRLAEEEHVLLLTLHHIAADGWSVRLLWRELQTLYNAYRRQAEPDLPELPLQYVDFAVWQRNELQGERKEHLVHYWRTQLDGLAVLDLPTDHARPPQPSYRGASLEFELPPGLAEQLRQLSRRENVTLHMALLAAFQTLLMRYSGQEDLAVGLPIAGRQQAELENLVGFFVNTLVLRTDLSGRPAFRELLARVRRVSLAAYDHQDLPFEKLVEELNPQRHLDRSPLFQVIFQLLDLPDSRPALYGLNVQWLPAQGGRARFDLEMYLRTQTEQGLRGSVIYSTDLFEAATIERLVAHFQTLLAGIVADPDTTIDRLPLMSEPERRQLLVEWNHTARDYPRDRCVHQLFEEQAERAPDTVAVVFGERQLTYRELNAQANRLAHYLRKLGIGPEVLVGVCVERSLEMVIGLLGILKAGGAYLPLDPQTPPQRLTFMLADGQVRRVLTQTSLRDRLEPAGVPLVCLDETTNVAAGQSQDNLPSLSDAENLAYVIYTSGSTGVPKGVEIPHRAINRLLFGVDYARFDAGLRVAQLAAVSFDAATLEIWGPLLHGGCCVLFPEGVPDLAELERGLRRHRIQTLWLTASLFNAIVDERPQVLRGIEQLLIGGEALSLPHVRRALSFLGPTTHLTNGYGPTECTTFACCYPIPEELPAESVSVPIGGPIGNTQAYVLDAHRQPVPIGVPGELYLGGDGLARGYLNRPELTAERFVASPFEGGTRLYRTGDRVRWRIDGTLEYLGRLDDQVKLRGFRIELGEIEMVLRQCAGVAQSVVALREDCPGDKRLVGYYVLGEGSSLSQADLARHVREQLPEYMVPSAFVGLERLPLTPNGKVDRRALPAPNHNRREAAKGYVPPRTALEQQLASIWAEVLGRERVGIHDNFFFDLGGHSLLAARLVSRIEQRTGQSVPLAMIFHEPTVSGLARHLQRPPAPADDLVQPLRSSGSRAPVLWFGNGRPLSYFTALVPPEHPLYWCKPEYLDGRSFLHTSIEDLAGQYCRQIRQLELRGSLVLCGYSFGGLLAYETARQLQELGPQAALVFLLEPTPPMSMASGSRGLHETLGQRVAREVRELWSARGGEKLPCLKRKSQAFFRFLTRPFALAYCDALLGLGLPVPVRLRWTYALNIYRRTIRDYVPKPIRAKLIVAHQEEYMGGKSGLWAGLAAGEFQRHVLPSPGHLDFLTMPCVEQWMRLLVSCL